MKWNGNACDLPSLSRTQSSELEYTDLTISNRLVSRLDLRNTAERHPGGTASRMLFTKLRKRHRWHIFKIS